MGKYIIIHIIISIYLMGCGQKGEKKIPENLSPRVSEGGVKIYFPSKENIIFFHTERLGNIDLNGESNFPAKVAAAVLSSQEGASKNVILFDDPELEDNYTKLIQHLINVNKIKNVVIKQKEIEYNRMKDLNTHGAATGKEVLEAKTELAMERTNLENEKTAIIEHEAALKLGGFDPVKLRGAPSGKIFIICNVPESRIGEINEGSECSIKFNSFPNQIFKGRLEEITAVIDNQTRMIKLRIVLDNMSDKVKVGMFATILFGVSHKNVLSVSKNSLITVQGQNYVFVKTSDSTFERREVSIGNQINERLIIYKGVKAGDTLAISGVMQLKGLSFGY